MSDDDDSDLEPTSRRTTHAAHPQHSTSPHATTPPATPQHNLQHNTTPPTAPATTPSFEVHFCKIHGQCCAHREKQNGIFQGRWFFACADQVETCTFFWQTERPKPTPEQAPFCASDNRNCKLFLVGRPGPNQGRYFWKCTAHPTCQTFYWATPYPHDPANTVYAPQAVPKPSYNTPSSSTTPIAQPAPLHSMLATAHTVEPNKAENRDPDLQQAIAFYGKDDTDALASLCPSPRDDSE